MALTIGIFDLLGVVGDVTFSESWLGITGSDFCEQKQQSKAFSKKVDKKPQ